MIELGSCVRVFDRTTKPPKYKLFICIHASNLWFLRINSRDWWGSSALVTADECAGVLLHDSYVELSAMHRLGKAPVAIVEEPDRYEGVVPRRVIERIALAACASDTLTPRQKREIQAAVFE